MKKILFAALAVSLLTVSCQKTEVIHQVGPTDGALMSFSTEMSKLTKSTDPTDAADADSVGMYNLRAQEFRIWAYCDYDDPTTDDGKSETTDDIELDKIYDGMENLNIDYLADASSAEGTWKPLKEYYWPSAGKALRFFAVSGLNLGDDLSEQEIVTCEINRSNNAEGESVVTPKMEIKTYAVTNTNPNTDLMVADFITQDKAAQNKDKRVTFNFRHALSKVQFKFKTQGTTPVYIQSLTVENIRTTGKLTVEENDGEDKATRPIKFTWAVNDNTQMPFSDDYKTIPEGFPTSEELMTLNQSSESDYDNTALKLTEDPEEFATWLVIPQDIVTTTDGKTSGYEVRVTYVINKRQFEATFPLYTSQIQRWDDNQYTKYLVTITPNKITFEAQAKPWTPQADIEDQN